ncbi:helix-turn-helix transcriptional regulator [Novosphingobium sp. BL-8A]|uniref:AraC family transcriptional regulator n=1 Tax=Novosphingobium sp. BL-8A TaxID=3127639 RepID=UPI003757BB80
MPVLTAADSAEWVEPDEVPRPIVAFGAAMTDESGLELDPHRHRKGQMLLVERGAISCEVDGGLWIVPPRSAIWIPGGALHSFRITGALAGYCAFVDPAFSTALPRNCCAVAVTPLLRELLARAAHLPYFYDEGGANSRLVSVILDELASARVEDLHLPMPADPRLRRIMDAMIAAPSDRGSLATWAKRAGLSERTMLRLVHRETGMSFGQWRRQLGVVLAVKWLAGGLSIQQVAADLGYESVPSFVTMFRKALGTPPARYMAERHAP